MNAMRCFVACGQFWRTTNPDPTAENIQQYREDIGTAAGDASACVPRPPVQTDGAST